MNDVDLHNYSQQNQIQGLSVGSLRAVSEHKSGYTIERARRFLNFQRRIDHYMLDHPVILDNEYCQWFELGEQNEEQLRDFVVQFSVFSNLFLLAQLHKTINADSLEGMRASKEILANEIGVVFNSGKTTPQQSEAPEYVAGEGTVEGGRFHFRAAHFEWLLKLGDVLGLSFNDMGKRCHGSESTLYYCDELSRLYGSADYMVSQAASYAVENWAAAGFWDQLIKGFESYNQAQDVHLPLGFFVWHARIEAQHAQHTQEELEELYFSRNIDEDAFIRDGNEMLDGVAAFWKGLDHERRRLAWVD